MLRSERSSNDPSQAILFGNFKPVLQQDVLSQTLKVIEPRSL